MFPTLPNLLAQSGSQATAVEILRLLEASTLSFPGLPAPVPTVTAISQGPGSTSYSYSYTVTAISALGAISTTSTTVTVTNNPLSAAPYPAGSYNRISWNKVAGALGYSISRTAGGTGQGIIAVVAAGNILQCEPAGALVAPSFPLMPSFEIHDTGLAVLGNP